MEEDGKEILQVKHTQIQTHIREEVAAWTRMEGAARWQGNKWTSKNLVEVVSVVAFVLWGKESPRLFRKQNLTLGV